MYYFLGGGVKWLSVMNGFFDFCLLVIYGVNKF